MARSGQKCSVNRPSPIHFSVSRFRETDLHCNLYERPSVNSSTSHIHLPPPPELRRMDGNRHVKGYHSTQQLRIRNAFDDVAITIHQSLQDGPLQGGPHLTGHAHRRQVRHLVIYGKRDITFMNKKWILDLHLWRWRRRGWTTGTKPAAGMIFIYFGDLLFWWLSSSSTL